MRKIDEPDDWQQSMQCAYNEDTGMEYDSERLYFRRDPMPVITIETITRDRYVNGVRVSHRVAATIPNAPHRIGKRATFAHQAGLQFVRSLGDMQYPSAIDGVPNEPTGIVYVGVFDSQRRLLAAWRRFNLGFTGTHDRHPMLGGRSMLWRRGK